MCINVHALPLPAQPSEQQIEQAAQQREWLHLLHYRKKNLSIKNKMQSIADDKTFFIATNGHINAADEIRSELKAMQATARLNNLSTTDKRLNEHPQCKFPARFDWLKKQFPNWAAQVISLPCPAYETWIKEMQPHSITLVFPAAYINSPSSMFGHTLFRVNSKSKTKQADILARSISYAADMPKEVSAWDYVYGGFFGGHPGYMYEANYYDKIIEYSDMDNRDIWEYPISLSQIELMRMLKHTWELQHVRFDYYFLDENCALRLLDILDIAKPGLNSAQHFTTHAIPADTVRILAAKNMLQKAVYRPARITKLKAELQQLSRLERTLIQHFASTYDLSRQDIALALKKVPTAKAQAKILDLTYQYLRYLVDKQKIQPQKASQRSLLLLSLRSKLPKVAEVIIEPPLAAEKGHKTMRLALGAGEFKQQPFGEIKLRPAFHDLLDNDAGYVAGAQINFLSLAARHYTDLNKTTFESLRLIDIKAHSVRDDFFKPFSWEFSIGWQRNELSTYDKTRFGIQAAGGITQALGQSTRITGLVKTDINGNAYLAGQWDTGIGAELSVLTSLPAHSPYLRSKLQLTASTWAYQDDNILDGHRLSATLNVPIINMNHALRLRWQQQFHTAIKNQPKTTEAALSWHYYF